MCTWNSKDSFDSYLARLQNIAGERPLLLTEIGLDSRRNGELAQSESLRSQISSAFAAGCAGAFVFAWTDEWYRGGHNIEDWDFGLTTRDRQPKAALTAGGGRIPRDSISEQRVAKDFGNRVQLQWIENDRGDTKRDRRAGLSKLRNHCC